MTKRITSYLITIACLALFVGACNHRADTINATLVAVDAARDGFVQWDKEERTQIVDKATSREQGLAELSAHDVKIAPVQKLITDAYRAIALAASKNDDASLNDAVKLVADVASSIVKLRGGP